MNIDVVSQTLDQLLEAGQATLAGERERLEKANALVISNKQIRFSREWAVPIAFLDATWPALSGCFEVPVFNPDEFLDGQLPRQSFRVGVRVPSLDWFEVCLRRTEAGCEFEEPAIHLYTSWVDSSLYGNESFVARDKRNPMTLESGSLAIAVALAREYGIQRANLALEVDTANENRAASYAARIAKQEAAPSDAERALALFRELVDLVHAHPEQE